MFVGFLLKDEISEKNTFCVVCLKILWTRGSTILLGINLIPIQLDACSFGFFFFLVVKAYLKLYIWYIMISSL